MLQFTADNSHPQPDASANKNTNNDGQLLDAYSQTVVNVAQRVSEAVVKLK